MDMDSVYLYFYKFTCLYSVTAQNEIGSGDGRRLANYASLSIFNSLTNIRSRQFPFGRLSENNLALMIYSNDHYTISTD